MLSRTLLNFVLKTKKKKKRKKERGCHLVTVFCFSILKWSEMKVAQSCPTLRPHGLYSPWNIPGQNTGMGSLSLLQGIFRTRGWSPGLLHCRRILYQVSHKESPLNFGNSWTWSPWQWFFEPGCALASPGNFPRLWIPGTHLNLKVESLRWGCSILKFFRRCCWS